MILGVYSFLDLTVGITTCKNVNWIKKSLQKTESNLPGFVTGVIVGHRSQVILTLIQIFNWEFLQDLILTVRARKKLLIIINTGALAASNIGRWGGCQVIEGLIDQSSVIGWIAINVHRYFIFRQVCVRILRDISRHVWSPWPLRSWVPQWDGWHWIKMFLIWSMEHYEELIRHPVIQQGTPDRGL